MIKPLLVAVLMMAFQSGAIASAESDDFLQMVTGISSGDGWALRTLGADYNAKCGVEPTVAQYREFLLDSPAYGFLLAAAAVDGRDVSRWPDNNRARYQAFLHEMECAKK